MSIGKSLMLALALVMLMATNLLTVSARTELIKKDGEDGKIVDDKLSGEMKEEEGDQKMMQTSLGHTIGTEKTEAIQALEKLDDSFQLCVLRGGLKITPIRFSYKIVHSIRQNEKKMEKGHYGKMPTLSETNCLDQVHQMAIEMEHKIVVNAEPRDECYTAKFVYYKGVEQFTNYIHALGFSLIVEKGKASQKHQIHLNAGSKMSARELSRSGVTLDLREMTAELGTRKYNLAIAKAHLEMSTQVAKGAFGIAKESAKTGLNAFTPMARRGIVHLGKGLWKRNEMVKAVDEPRGRIIEEFWD